MFPAGKSFHERLDFYERLVDGDERACRDLVYRHREDQGASVLRICEALTEAFHRIGEAWECSEVEVYREHIASQIAYRLLLDLGSLMSIADQEAPAAIGCAPDCDPYVLPTCMVELVLRDLGWRAQSLGTNLPLEMLAPAIDDIQPRLCWVSVSYIDSMARMREQLSLLGGIGCSKGVKVVCGGRALSDEVKHGHTGITFLTELRELQAPTAYGF